MLISDVKCLVGCDLSQARCRCGSTPSWLANVVLFSHQTGNVGAQEPFRERVIEARTGSQTEKGVCGVNIYAQAMAGGQLLSVCPEAWKAQPVTR